MQRNLRADCSACCGLCCVAPAFDVEQGFGANKPAHTPCTHLDLAGRCQIHQTREAHGFRACIAFDCFGAGQWVTQALHDGRSWRESPELALDMFRQYSRYRVLHELLAMLEVAVVRQPDLHDDVQLLRAEVLAACELPDASDEQQLRRRVLARLRERLRKDARGP